MRSILSAIAGLLLWCPLPCRAQAPASPPSTPLEPGKRDSVIEAIAKDRQETQEWLRTSPTSYLATINRVDFGTRTSLTVGRGTANDLRIDDAEVSTNHLRVTVVGDSFAVEVIDPGAVFLVKQKQRKHATLPPSSIGVGRFVLRLSHQRSPAIIAFDPASPRTKEYKGLSYFPVDLRYCFVTSLTRALQADTVAILSTRGNRRKALRVGWFEFSVDGIRCRLAATRLLEPGVGEKDYSIFFRDLTCGSESYPMGRYVEAEGLPDGSFLVDFNRAYNPACAFSVYYNCPIPPPENDLRVRIPAGEKDAHYLEH